ncbi:MAG TPA: phosphatase PAP2 family protein [Allosphingosinicella sp.]|nr:phosphatase PAP2 family protein [Allosphingosinicella sp.]
MPIALLGLVIAWGVMLLFGGMELDRALLLLAYAGDHDKVGTVARWLTELGGYPVLLAVTAAGSAILLIRREWRSAILLLGITLGGRALVHWQKIWTGRVRPEDQVHLVQVQSLSFPSGHAANATMVWLCLALLLPRTIRARTFAIWGAVWLALAVGLSRVVLGVHWPSDVIGGWAFGLFWTMLLLRLSGHSIDEATLPNSAQPVLLAERD